MNLIFLFEAEAASLPPSLGWHHIHPGDMLPKTIATSQQATISKITKEQIRFLEIHFIIIPNFTYRNITSSTTSSCHGFIFSNLHFRSLLDKGQSRWPGTEWNLTVDIDSRDPLCLGQSMKDIWCALDDSASTHWRWLGTRQSAKTVLAWKTFKGWSSWTRMTSSHTHWTNDLWTVTCAPDVNFTVYTQIMMNQSSTMIWPPAWDTVAVSRIHVFPSVHDICIILTSR